MFEAIASDGAYSEADAARVVRQVCEALAHLHARDIAHRDLKPENLLHASASRASNVKVADFGLASWCGGDARLTDQVGTILYTSPEVFLLILI